MGIILVMALLALQTDARHGQPPQSVCDVIFNDPTKLNGKVVRIRGLLSSTDEGIWLREECKTHLVTKGLTWGNSLWVYIDESDENIARSWEKMGARLTELRADTRRDRVRVTIVGRVETRASMDDEVIQMPYGLAKAGFGHLGGSPAEINVISVGDVALEHQSQDAKHTQN
jgi:hypothetical protein